MFLPVVSSTATTLCAFLPMLFLPGVPGQFIGMLPVTLIFVLSASLIVALIYLPILGGVSGRLSRFFETSSDLLRDIIPWFIRLPLVALVTGLLCISILQVANPNLLLDIDVEEAGPIANLPGVIMFILSAFMASIVLGSIEIRKKQRNVRAGYRRTPFGYFIKLIAGNPIMPIVAIGGVVVFTSFIFTTFGKNNYGVEFFVEGEPEQAIVYVKARGNLSLVEKDILVRQAELIVNAHPGVESVFSFAGAGGLNQNTAGATAPKDTIGQVQLETIPWEDRRGNDDLDGNKIIAELSNALRSLPGIEIEIL